MLCVSTIQLSTNTQCAADKQHTCGHAVISRSSRLKSIGFLEERALLGREDRA